MTARTGLANLIATLRGMTNAGTADYTIGTAAYWDDDHVQDVLDRHRVDVYNEQLGIIERWTAAGSVSYFEYQSAYGNFEATTGGTAIFWIEDGVGVDVGTANYTVDYYRGRVTFSADTGGSVFYLTGRSYDLNGAAADIWRMKAAQVANAFDFSTDNHNLRRSQILEHYQSMAQYYEKFAAPISVLIERNDRP